MDEAEKENEALHDELEKCRRQMKKLEQHYEEANDSLEDLEATIKRLTEQLELQTRKVNALRFQLDRYPHNITLGGSGKPTPR